jgi:hypothetical protein
MMNCWCQPIPLEAFPDIGEVSALDRNAGGAHMAGQAGDSWTGSSKLREPEGSRVPRCGPTTSPRNPRTAPAAESAAVLPAREVPRSTALPRASLAGEQPPPGGQTGATRACHWTGSADRAAANLQPLQHPPTLVSHHRAASFPSIRRDLTAKLTANHSDPRRCPATSADEQEPSTCRDGQQRTALDARGRVGSSPVTPPPGPHLARRR